MSSTQLPNKEKACVPRHKVVNYLLSETHSVGKSKARFFRSLGFDENTASELEQGLVEIAQTGEVKESIRSPYGIKYVSENPARSFGADPNDMDHRVSASGSPLCDRLSDRVKRRKGRFL